MIATQHTIDQSETRPTGQPPAHLIPNLDRDDTLVGQYLTGDLTMLAIANANGLTMRQFIEWTRRDDIAQLLADIAQASTLRAQRLAAESAPAAIAKLAGTLTSPNAEVARKAATTLLRHARPISRPEPIHQPPRSGARLLPEASAALASGSPNIRRVAPAGASESGRWQSLFKRGLGLTTAPILALLILGALLSGIFASTQPTRALLSSARMHNGSLHGAGSPGPAANGSSLPAHPDQPVILCRGVHKAYHLGERAVYALRGVDLEIKDSGFYGIMGASGSGKSTLMHLLAALDVPDQGQVSIAGRDLAGMNDYELTLFRRKQIGIVFQQFNLIPTLSAVENVQLPGILAGDPEGPLKARALELLEAMGLQDRAEHKPDSLSGGEQQRVAICRSLLYKPPVVLADEPTGNLDSRNAERLWSLLAQIAKEHSMTIIMVTHEPAAASHCKRVFVLQDGLVKGQLETEGLDASGVAARYQQLVATA